MKAAIAVFVKTPGHSAVKTRLAASEGQCYAETWHRHAAAAVGSVVQRASDRVQGLIGYWAVAEADALDDPAWSGLPRVLQGEGGLGQRLHSVYNALQQRHGAVLLIGADSPQMTAPLLLEGLAALEQGAARAVLGPSEDGGFWIAGGNVALPAHVWTQVHYSGRETALDMRCSLAPYARCSLLPRLRDLDNASDLPLVRAALEGLADPTEAQRRLLDWMRSHDAVAA